MGMMREGIGGGGEISLRKLAGAQNSTLLRQIKTTLSGYFYLAEVVGRYSANSAAVERHCKALGKANNESAERISRTYEPSSARLLRHRLSMEQLQQLVCDYAGGMSTADVAERYGIGETTARELIKARGALRPASKLSADDVAEIMKMRARGATYSDIGGKFGVSKVAVWRRLRQ